MAPALDQAMAWTAQYNEAWARPLELGMKQEKGNLQCSVKLVPPA